MGLQNYFATYGVQGSPTRRHYVRDVRPANTTGLYRFGAMDLVNDPGLRSPFMFFGLPQAGLADFAAQLNSTCTRAPSVCVYVSR
jgi:hypothetical protein